MLWADKGSEVMLDPLAVAWEGQDERIARRDLSERQVELILMRAAYLDESDAVMVRASMTGAANSDELASVRGVGARAVQRRLKGLRERLLDPEVAAILRRGREWPGVTRKIGHALWVRGWSLRTTARRLNMTLHEVRVQQGAVRGLLARERVRGESGVRIDGGAGAS